MLRRVVSSLDARACLLWLLAVVAGPSAVATETFDDQVSFDGATSADRFAGFDDVTVGKTTPFDSGGVKVLAQNDAAVIESVVSLGHEFWFPGVNSAPNFLITNIQAIELTFPAPVTAAGFNYAPFAVDDFSGESSIAWLLQSANGETLDSGSLPASGFSGAQDPGFFGLKADTAFTTLIVERVQTSSPEEPDGGNWFMDAIRFAPAGPTSPLPRQAVGVPATSVYGLAILGAMLALVVAVRGSV